MLTPLVRVMTAMTEATPMTTRMSVSTERSLLAQRDWSAILKASLSSIGGRFPEQGGSSTSLAAAQSGICRFCDQRTPSRNGPAPATREEDYADGWAAVP